MIVIIGESGKEPLPVLPVISTDAFQRLNCTRAQKTKGPRFGMPDYWINI